MVNKVADGQLLGRIEIGRGPTPRLGDLGRVHEAGKRRQWEQRKKKKVEKEDMA